MALGAVAQAGIKIADRVRDGEILVVVLADLFVLSNGVLQLALLDKLLRGAENLLLVEAETKRHRIEPNSRDCRGTKSEVRSQNAEVKAGLRTVKRGRLFMGFYFFLLTSYF